MLVIIRNAPDTAEGRRGIKIAQSVNADVVLLQNGVYFAKKEAIEEFWGKMYVLQDDAKLRGVRTFDETKKIETISYDGIVDLMAGADKVYGLF